jgi:hypothetical protein
MSIYDVGDSVRTSAVFTNSAGTTGDPGMVRLLWRDPSGTVGSAQYLTSSAVVREKTGCYYLETALGMPGTLWLRWESTGVTAGAVEGSVSIRHSKIS